MVEGHSLRLSSWTGGQCSGGFPWDSAQGGVGWVGTCCVHSARGLWLLMVQGCLLYESGVAKVSSVGGAGWWSSSHDPSSAGYSSSGDLRLDVWLQVEGGGQQWDGGFSFCSESWGFSGFSPRQVQSPLSVPSVGRLSIQMVVGMERFQSWPHLGVRLREESWPPSYHPRISYGGRHLEFPWRDFPEGPVVNSEPELPVQGPGLITPMDWGTKELHVTWHGQNKIPCPPSRNPLVRKCGLCFMTWVPGILFLVHGHFVKWKCWSLSCFWLFATPWTVAHQAPLPMGFSRQEYWSGLPFLSPGDLPDSGLLHCRWILYHLRGKTGHFETKLKPITEFMMEKKGYRKPKEPSMRSKTPINLCSNHAQEFCS